MQIIDLTERVVLCSRDRHVSATLCESWRPRRRLRRPAEHLRIAEQLAADPLHGANRQQQSVCHARSQRGADRCLSHQLKRTEFYRGAGRARCPAERNRMTGTSDPIALGRESWSRLKDRERKSWDDWIAVGRALIIGRSEAMLKAGCNRPIGTGYVRAFGGWKRDRGLADITPQATYRALQVIECIKDRPHFP
jgi:hypothetical protein